MRHKFGGPTTQNRLDNVTSQHDRGEMYRLVFQGKSSNPGSRCGRDDEDKDDTNDNDNNTLTLSLSQVVYEWQYTDGVKQRVMKIDKYWRWNWRWRRSTHVGRSPSELTTVYGYPRATLLFSGWCRWDRTGPSHPHSVGGRTGCRASRCTGVWGPSPPAFLLVRTRPSSDGTKMSKEYNGISLRVFGSCTRRCIYLCRLLTWWEVS